MVLETRKRHNAPYTPEERHQMVELYKGGQSVGKIAAIIGCSVTTICKILNKSGVAIRPKGWVAKKPSAEAERQLVELYEDGLGLKAIAAKTGFHDRMVRTTLCKLGISIRGRGGSAKTYSQDVRRKMVDLYENGLSQSKVAAKFNCNICTVGTVLREFGVEARSGDFQPKFSEQDCLKVVTMYQSGKTMREIASEFECSQNVVANALVKHGVTIRTRSMSSRYSTEDRNRMVEMVENGATRKSIADEFGCSIGLVKHFLHQHARSKADPSTLVKDTVKKKRTRYGRRFTQHNYRQMVSLYEQGWSSLKIAEKFDCSAGYVREKLLDFGVKVRPFTMPKLDFSEEYRHRMVEMYQNGYDVQSIADEFWTSSNPVTRVLREAGVTLRPRIGLPKFTEQDRQKMVTMYQSGLSQRKVAAQFGCNSATVLVALRENGIKARSCRRVSRFSDEDCNQIVSMYQNGKTHCEIACMFGCSSGTIGSILQKQKIKSRPTGCKSRYSSEDRNRMAEMYQGGWTQKAIAQEFGCSPAQISHFLQEHQRKVVAPPVKESDKTHEKLNSLVRDYWQNGNRAVEMMLLPQEARMKILEHVRNALHYACEQLG
jgi:transposase-like protein